MNNEAYIPYSQVLCVDDAPEQGTEKDQSIIKYAKFFFFDEYDQIFSRPGPFWS